MTTLAGKGLLFGGCVALGILTGLGRLRRVACLADFRRSLSGLARELTFSLRPLPELAEDVGGSGPAGECLRACRRCFLASGGESWTGACWRSSARSWAATTARASSGPYKPCWTGWGSRSKRPGRRPGGWSGWT